MADYNSIHTGPEIDEAVRKVKENDIPAGGVKFSDGETFQQKYDAGELTGPKGETGAQGPKGDTGDTGPQGPAGADGAPGQDGKSAYESAQDGGYTGTEAEFNAALSNVGNTTAEDVSFTPGTTGMSATNVQEAVTELFTSVSDGKTLVAAAITDKGVTTAATDSFAQMADNVAAITTGGKTKTVKFKIVGEQSFVTVYYSTKDAAKELFMEPGTSYEIDVVESSIFIAIGTFYMPYNPSGIIKVDISSVQAYFVSQNYNSEVIEIY